MAPSCTVVYVQHVSCELVNVDHTQQTLLDSILHYSQHSIIARWPMHHTAAALTLSTYNIVNGTLSLCVFSFYNMYEEGDKTENFNRRLFFKVSYKRKACNLLGPISFIIIIITEPDQERLAQV